jgi:hypothetical protein
MRRGERERGRRGEGEKRNGGDFSDYREAAFSGENIR